MKTLKEIKKRLICLKKEHLGEQINYLCVEAECEGELCCYICQEESHKAHPMLSVKILISRIEQIRNLPADVLTLSAALDQKVVTIHRFLADNRNEFTDFPLILHSLDKFVELKHNNLLSLLELPSILQNLACLDAPQFQKQFAQFYKTHSQHFQLQDQKQAAQLSIYNNNLKSNIEQLKSIQQSLRKLEQEDKVNDHQILKFFPLEQEKTKMFKPHFTEAFKGSCMKVTLTTAEMVTTGTQRVVAMQPSLQVSSRVKKWRIKITKLASWIGVGACHINKLKQANWQFNYSSTQHGSYFISSNGYSWSSFKPEFNSKFEPFTFKTGDTISLEYHPKEKILKFQKQILGSVGTSTYSLQIENNGDQLHPAVNLTGVGDSVEILI